LKASEVAADLGQRQGVDLLQCCDGRGGGQHRNGERVETVGRGHRHPGAPGRTTATVKATSPALACNTGNLHLKNGETISLRYDE
jgi:hypothetical protein